MDLEEVRWEGISRIDLDQDKDKCHIVLNMVLKILLP